jgi:hypothetical protein
MKILLRIVAVVFVAIGLFLLAAVINALASEGGARAGVAIGYVIGGALLVAAAVWLWRYPSRRAATGPAGPGA